MWGNSLVQQINFMLTQNTIPDQTLSNAGNAVYCIHKAFSLSGDLHLLF